MQRLGDSFSLKGMEPADNYARAQRCANCGRARGRHSYPDDHCPATTGFHPTSTFAQAADPKRER